MKSSVSKQLQYYEIKKRVVVAVHEFSFCIFEQSGHTNVVDDCLSQIIRHMDTEECLSLFLASAFGF